MWVTGRKAATEPGLMVSIMVDDIEVTINAIIVNGGKIVQPVTVFGSEKVALFSDPSGNIFSLYQSSRRSSNS